MAKDRAKRSDEAEVEAQLNDELAAEFSDLVSMWADLLTVEMALHYRSELRLPKDLFLARTLWEAAVIAYGRCFTTGRRRNLPEKLQRQISGDGPRVHAEVLRQRNKLVAHAVDRRTLWTRVSLVYSNGSLPATQARVRVALPVGPDDERLAKALGELATALKNRLWKQFFPSLERRILEAHGQDSALYSQARSFRDERGSFVTINPTGTKKSR